MIFPAVLGHAVVHACIIHLYSFILIKWTDGRKNGRNVSKSFEIYLHTTTVVVEMEQIL